MTPAPAAAWAPSVSVPWLTRVPPAWLFVVLIVNAPVPSAAKLNNARLEGIADKPSFRQAVRRRRCILPASGFYEWQATPGGKQPWYISPNNRDDHEPLFAFAGLFEAWRAPGAAADTDWLLSCCIITTAANSLMAPIHDRMPVMLAPEHWEAWLARGNTDAASLPALMQGLPEGAMQAWPVARTVGRSSAEGPALIEPLPAPLAG